MQKTRTTGIWVALTAVVVLVAVGMASKTGPASTGQPAPAERALKSVTLNTAAYAVGPAKIDKRSVRITADDDMHIVALEHFTGYFHHAVRVLYW